MISLLKKAFPEKKFRFDDIYQGGNNYYIQIKTEGSDDECAALSIRDTEIYVSSLHKCGFSGSEILKKIEKFARLLQHVNKITITDISTIKICGMSISLAMLKIITKGESWYNSLGYRSVDYDDEKIHNSIFINRSYNDFIDELDLMEKTHESFQDVSLKETGQELFPDIDMNMSLQSYFNNILQIMNCDNFIMVTWLRDILYKISEYSFVKYNNDLVKTLDKSSLLSSSKRRSKRVVTKKGGRKRTGRRRKN